VEGFLVHPDIRGSSYVVDFWPVVAFVKSFMCIGE